MELNVPLSAYQTKTIAQTPRLVLWFLAMRYEDGVDGTKRMSFKMEYSEYPS